MSGENWVSFPSLDSDDLMSFLIKVNDTIVARQYAESGADGGAKVDADESTVLPVGRSVSGEESDHVESEVNGGTKVEANESDGYVLQFYVLYLAVALASLRFLAGQLPSFLHRYGSFYPTCRDEGIEMGPVTQQASSSAQLSR